MSHLLGVSLSTIPNKARTNLVASSSNRVNHEGVDGDDVVRVFPALDLEIRHMLEYSTLSVILP
jgi:hypothetical protein